MSDSVHVPWYCLGRECVVTKSSYYSASIGWGITILDFVSLQSVSYDHQKTHDQTKTHTEAEVQVQSPSEQQTQALMHKVAKMQEHTQQEMTKMQEQTEQKMTKMHEALQTLSQVIHESIKQKTQ